MVDGYGSTDELLAQPRRRMEVMETYHKIQTLFKRDLDGSLTGKKGKMIEGAWTTNELKYLADNQWEFTEKVDGTNIRIGFNRGLRVQSGVEFAGRSDNATIPGPLMRYLGDTFTPELFEKSDLSDIILFGEGYGPKIQGGGKYRDDHSFVLFDVKIGSFWLTRPNVNDVANKLGIEFVPTIGYGTLYDGISLVKANAWTKAGVIQPPKNPDYMQSAWGDFEAEGIVARPSVPMFDRKGERIITKIKAVDFR